MTDRTAEIGGARRTPFAARLESSLARESRDGLVLAAKARLVIAVALAFWALFDRSSTGGAYWYQFASVALFIPTTALHWLAAKTGGPRFAAVYGLFAVELVIVGVLAVMPNPFIDPRPTPQMMLQIVSFYWFFAFMLHAAFALDARLIIWTGVWVFLVRAGQIAYVLTQPGVTSEWGLDPGDYAGFQARFYTPEFVFLFQRLGDLVFAASATGIAAVLVRRTRRLVFSQAATERERAQLARYVPAPVIDEISAGKGPFREPERREVAVAFVDIVGFTRFTETHAPEMVAAMLRDYHDFAATAVFDHGGAIEKFIGDGIMATFGITEDHRTPADAALAAACDMIDAARAWNVKREARGWDVLNISIGLDTGPCVIANVGVDRRLELAVIGDPVNTAARIEVLSRALQAHLVATDRFVAAVPGERRAAQPLVQVGAHAIRGKAEPITLWMIPRES